MHISRNLFMAALTVASFAWTPAVLAAAPCTPHSISVNGHGEVHVAPGRYVFHLGISQRSADVPKANAAVDLSAGKVVRAARRAGLALTDIRSTQVTISPVYNPKAGPGEPQVFEVTRNITLTLRDPTRYADLVEGLIKAGVNRIARVEAEPADRQELADKALAAAVADARRKAKVIADGLGVKLGPALSLDEQGYQGPRPVVMNAVRSADRKGGYEPGRITVNASVSARFATDPSGCPVK